MWRRISAALKPICAAPSVKYLPYWNYTFNFSFISSPSPDDFFYSLISHIQRMGAVSWCLRRCLWVGSYGVPPPRPPTSWPLTLGRGAHRYARDGMARLSSPKIMFACTPQSPCLAWLSTTQVRLNQVFLLRNFSTWQIQQKEIHKCAASSQDNAVVYRGHEKVKMAETLVFCTLLICSSQLFVASCYLDFFAGYYWLCSAFVCLIVLYLQRMHC